MKSDSQGTDDQGTDPGFGPDGPSVRALNVAGLGLHAGHLTREVETLLTRCERVYYLHTDPETVERLSELCAESLVDLSTFYEAGASRLDTYYGIAAHVIASASRNPPVGVALYGHPMVLSTLSNMLIRGGRRFGLDVEVYPGVSSVDGILATLGVDPGQVALQTHEATELLAFARPLDRHSGLLIFQAGQLGTQIHTPSMAPSPRHARQLAGRLAECYGADHEITAVELRQSGSGWEWRGTVSEFPEAAARFNPNFTIYVPPAARPPVRDPEILRGLNEIPEAGRLSH